LRFFFEDYSFDTDRRELQRGADVIPVAPQVFDLLEYLIRNRERQPNFLGAQRMVISGI
jgi:DNA-binding winged helix-turn-helix (wHTH) protein